jgi:hypothetical protein
MAPRSAATALRTIFNRRLLSLDGIDFAFADTPYTRRREETFSKDQKPVELLL